MIEFLTTICWIVAALALSGAASLLVGRLLYWGEKHDC